MGMDETIGERKESNKKKSSREDDNISYDDLTEATPIRIEVPGIDDDVDDDYNAAIEATTNTNDNCKRIMRSIEIHIINAIFFGVFTLAATNGKVVAEILFNVFNACVPLVYVMFYYLSYVPVYVVYALATITSIWSIVLMAANPDYGWSNWVGLVSSLFHALLAFGDFRWEFQRIDDESVVSDDIP